MRDVALDIKIKIEDTVWQKKFPRLQKKMMRAVEMALLTQNKVRLTHDCYEVSILLTDDAAIRKLNRTHRGFDKPTNVLSFPLLEGEKMPIMDGVPIMLGDIVLTSGVITAEAKAQKKTFKQHLLHLVVHGVLHLCGYDHITNGQARTMERLEKEILEEII